MVEQDPLHPSSVHLPTQVVFVSSQLLLHVSTLRPVWLTVGFSTLVVHPDVQHASAKRMDGTLLILLMLMFSWTRDRAPRALLGNTNAKAQTFARLRLDAR